MVMVLVHGVDTLEWMARNKGMFSRTHFQEFNHDKLMTEHKREMERDREKEKITVNERNKGNGQQKWKAEG